MIMQQTILLQDSDYQVFLSEISGRNRLTCRLNDSAFYPTNIGQPNTNNEYTLTLTDQNYIGLDVGTVNLHASYVRDVILPVSEVVNCTINTTKTKLGFNVNMKDKICVVLDNVEVIQNAISRVRIPTTVYGNSYLRIVNNADGTMSAVFKDEAVGKDDIHIIHKYTSQWMNRQSRETVHQHKVPSVTWNAHTEAIHIKLSNGFQYGFECDSRLGMLYIYDDLWAIHNVRFKGYAAT